MYPFGVVGRMGYACKRWKLILCAHVSSESSIVTQSLDVYHQNVLAVRIEDVSDCLAIACND